MVPLVGLVQPVHVHEEISAPVHDGGVGRPMRSVAACEYGEEGRANEEGLGTGRRRRMGRRRVVVVVGVVVGVVREGGGGRRSWCGRKRR